MASKTNKPAQGDSTETTIDTKADLLEELNQAMALRKDPLPDGFALDTNFVVEDRTDAPVEEPEVEYEVETLDMGNGFVLETRGEAVSA